MKFLKLLLILMSVTSAVRADKLDIATNTDIINRLENVISNMDREDDLMQKSWLRLADVYAERARLYAMQESEEKCTVCKTAKNDRLKALSYYQKSFDRADLDQGKREAILLQIAHLEELNGETDKTIALYKKIIKGGTKQYSPALIGQAHTGLGDIAFRKAQVVEAQKHYDNALKIKETPRRLYIQYRLAWCHFNQDRLKKSIDYLVKILESKQTDEDIASTSPSNSSFKEDVARDLATFYAKGHVGQAEIENLVRLTPEVARVENVTYLAKELERLGKKKPALLAWSKAQSMGALREKDGNPIFANGALEEQINIAQLQFETGKYDESTTALDNALVDWRDNGCKEPNNCDEARKHIRKILVNLQKTAKPSKALLNLFGLYVSEFKDDSEITYLAGGIAQKLKDWDFATLYYQQSANLNAEAIKKKDIPANIELAKNNLEAALLGEIEVAELTKDPKRKMAAYDHYLDINPHGDKNVDVRYQKANLLYESGDHENAAKGFREVALIKDKESRSTRFKAANLALDALVLAKETESIEPWAKEFSREFPEHQSEFDKIARKAALNVAVEAVANQDASKSDLQKGLTKLKGINLQSTPTNDRMTIYRNRLVIAEKLGDLNEVNDSANLMLASPKLSAQDRELAKSRKVWVAEQNRDYKTAFTLTKQMKMSGLSKEDKILKLILSAELAGQNPTPYYNQYLSLKGSHSAQYESNAQNIMVKMIRQSSNPVRQLAHFESRLKKNINLYSQLCLEVFASTHDYAFAERVSRNRQVRNSAAGHSIAKFIFLKKFKSAQKQFRMAKLDSRSNSLLKRSLQQRLSLIKHVEAWAKQGSTSQDWTLQIVTLTALSEQYRKLAQDISSLPVPRKLNRAQVNEYKHLLEQQAAPFADNHRQVQAKLQDLWNSTDMIRDLQKQMGGSQKSVQKLLAEEVNMLVSLKSGAKL